MVTVPIPGGAMGAGGAPASGGGMSTGAVIGLVVAVAVVVLFVCGGLMVALMLPAVQAAREAARRTQCANNLKQIALALHNYHDTYNSFPPAYTVDQNGKPLHSWRTLILPYLEQEALFRQIDLNEPWDSPKNLPYSQVSLKVFECPSDPTTGPHTCYLAITGKGTLFEGDKGLPLAAVMDGTSNTIAIVEVEGMPVNWMEPKDIDIEQFVSSTGGPGGAGAKHLHGFNTAFADGSVRFLMDQTDPITKRALATRAGGEAVRLP
jgi:prepilin-type processing-associated H-X9-DG protein